MNIKNMTGDKGKRVTSNLKNIIIFLLIVTVRSDELITWSGTSTTSVMYPPNNYTILSNQYLLSEPNFFGYGPQWIWVHSPPGTWPRDGTFQTIFYSDCPQAQGNITIRVDDAFVGYLNGRQFGAGSGSKKTFSFKLNLRCGANNLTIVAHNTDAKSSGALIFKVTQDQKDCFKCQPSAYYNYNTCQCECSADVYCNAPKQKASYPTCGCKCMNQPFTYCDYDSQYFNEATCKCQCRTISCFEGFEQDPESCACKCKAQTCGQGKVWSYSKCQCVKPACAQSITCPKPKEWNTSSCQCSCPSNVACPSGKAYSQQTCTCN